jgi:hypothetical protein
MRTAHDSDSNAAPVVEPAVNPTLEEITDGARAEHNLVQWHAGGMLDHWRTPRQTPGSAR